MRAIDGDAVIKWLADTTLGYQTKRAIQSTIEGGRFDIPVSPVDECVHVKDTLPEVFPCCVKCGKDLRGWQDPTNKEIE